MYQVNQADVIEWANSYAGEPFHALLCDPPYELNFMNRNWDNTGISFRKETWEAIGRIMYPGAFGMAFGGARTAHRMAVAIEDAGFIIHPMIGWVYGSGFPKATRLDTRIDAEAGAEREEVGTVRRWGANAGKGRGNQYANEYEPSLPGAEKFDAITDPATDLAKAWVGHRYGLQALKPALEPIIVFQKPYEGRPLDSITRTGAGALNIDGSRIGSEAVISNRWIDDAHPFGGGAGNEYETVHNHGRWPANVVLSHHPDCTNDGDFFTCVPECPVKAMGKQGGILKSGKPAGLQNKGYECYGGYAGGIPVTGFGDEGTAARYFYNADWMYERMEEDDGFFYCAKANRTERDAGLDRFAADEVLIGAAGHKTNPMTGKPVVDIPRRNHHPAVKPIALAQHLATLLLPPAIYMPRRILVPFSGSGSEMIGALRAGWEHIDGIEYDPEYCALARARLDHWARQGIQRKLF